MTSIVALEEVPCDKITWDSNESGGWGESCEWREWRESRSEAWETSTETKWGTEEKLEDSSTETKWDTEANSVESYTEAELVEGFTKLKLEESYDKIIEREIKWSLIYRASTATRYYSPKELERFEKQVIEIIRQLATKDNYVIYGYWLCRKFQCKHVNKCPNIQYCENKYRREQGLQDGKCENRCEREWKVHFDNESLKKYLKATPRWQSDFFMKCDEIHRYDYKLYRYRDENRYIPICSFLLYTPTDDSEKPTIEIIRHLVWKKHYRVFGYWKCSYCKKKWRSAYTWISLQKFINRIPGKNLNQNDYISQECKTCNKIKNNRGIITSYEPLVMSEDSVEHKRDLCAKCKAGEVCFDADTYRGFRA